MWLEGYADTFIEDERREEGNGGGVVRCPVWDESPHLSGRAGAARMGGNAWRGLTDEGLERTKPQEEKSWGAPKIRKSEEGVER